MSGEPRNLRESMERLEIPMAVCSVVGDFIRGSHPQLNALFEAAGAPGPPPDMAHHSKWKMWLFRLNSAPYLDPAKVLGRVMEEYMDVPPRADSGWVSSLLGVDFPDPVEAWKAEKKRVEEVLLEHGLKYVKGGKVIKVNESAAGHRLREQVGDLGLDEVQVELERISQNLHQDPAAAIAAACALLEALFKQIVRESKVTHPKTLSIGPLWKSVKPILGFKAENQGDQDALKVLGGLNAVVDGIACMRTHGSSAHGGGGFRYKVGTREASLVLGAAHTLAVFVIETWMNKKGDAPSGGESGDGKTG